MEDLNILDMGDPFQIKSLTTIYSPIFQCIIDQLQFGIDIGLKGSMSADVSKTTMYCLDIFKSLNVFEGEGVILMTSMLVFHLTK
jgi:hypothetical protein